MRQTDYKSSLMHGLVVALFTLSCVDNYSSCGLTSMFSRADFANQQLRKTGMKTLRHGGYRICKEEEVRSAKLDASVSWSGCFSCRGVSGAKHALLVLGFWSRFSADSKKSKFFIGLKQLSGFSWSQNCFSDQILS